ncbi:MAG: PadR family transcriptional regulator [Gemmatimonadota bacterium]|nr:PadR family transcriptional regulator [Gemmatimonadota bacterium]
MSLDHILLGYLQTPATGYDLGREFEEGARHFWFAERSQIYPTLRRMEKRGWLESHQAPSERGPQRKVYTRTQEGLAELRTWLTEEPRIGHERLAYIAQAAFLGSVPDLEDAIQVVRRMRAVWEQKLAYLEYAESEVLAQAGDWLDQPREAFHMYSALRLGLAQYRAKLAWCEETIHRLERRRAAAGNDATEEVP